MALRHVRPPFSLLGFALLGLSLACGGGGSGLEGRYPEKKRPPDAPRSASDGEVLGAQRQDPADTLEGSLTTGHAAPRSPHAEEPAEAAHEQLEYEQCVEENQAATQAAATPGGAARKKRVCPPPADSKE